jgi:fibronectin type 3 domain-containing protein
MRQWMKINKTLLDRTTYKDENVQPGVKYYYYVTAVDTSGNESDPSEVRSETAL